MSRRYVLAVDQGTTSTRAILFDRSGRLVALRQHEHEQHFPQPGWVEHDASEIWTQLSQLVPAALADAEAGPGDVAAIGIANQRETSVVWERATGRPIHRAIVWQDTRTAGLIESMAADPRAARVSELCGLPFAPYFSASRLRWILDAVPGARQRAVAGELMFGTMESWLIWNLTGGANGGLHLTDVTNASRSMLMNIRTCRWDRELLAFFDVPAQVLPEIRPSIERYGACTQVLPGVAIGAALGDQQAALFGQTCFEAGEAKCTYGTGSFVLLNTGTELLTSRHGLIPTVAFQAAGEPVRYALEGSIAVTGSLVQWLRDGLGLISSAPEIETLARTVGDNGGCYIVPAFAGLLAPHWRSDARGVITGLTSYVTSGHLARAVLEATAWQTREVIDAMTADTGLALRELRVDGGMTANNLLMQFIADILDTPVVRPMMAETVSLGAAYASGLAVGMWPDRTSLRRNWHRAAEWNPSMDSALRDREYANWQEAVTRSYAGPARPAGETAARAGVYAGTLSGS
jgi:glycerol kinase